jgi:glycosyltransferase involved in cell wall biosynthesis
MQLFLDVTRLCQRGRRSTPSGIDRVEYAYFAHLLEHERIEPDFVVFQRLFAGVLRQERAQDLRRMVEESWRLTQARDDESAYRTLKATLESPPPREAQTPTRVVAPAPAGPLWGEGVLFSPRDMLRARVRLDRRVRARGRRKAVYLHTSHAQLDKPAIPRWLESADVEPVFFLHDIIPIDYPEYCRPGECGRHLARLSVISEHARLVLVNSQATADAARARLDANGWRVPPFAVAPLAVEDRFRTREGLDPPRAAHPYAVVVGTIEARKNHAFLFAIWRRIVERWGEKAPRLVVIGRRGWENENVLDYLERSSLLAPYLIEASDLSDGSLANLIAGASALLAPSMAEGFDLPVAEALSLGTPTIASDLAVHREIGGTWARYLDPLDGPGWMRAIEEACLSPDPGPRPSGYVGLTWREHVALALGHIEESLASGRTKT